MISASSSPVSTPSPRSTVTCVRRESMSSPGFLRFSAVSSWKYTADLEHRLLVLGARLDLARLAVEARRRASGGSAGARPRARRACARSPRPGTARRSRRPRRTRSRRRAASRKPQMTSRIIGSSAVTACGREHPADERAEAVVLRRIHHDDAAEARDLLRVHREREQLDAVRARERLPVAVRGQHVGEARQRVEPVLLAEVDGRLVAEPPVHLGGIVEVLVRERIELDGARRRRS